MGGFLSNSRKICRHFAFLVYRKTKNEKPKNVGVSTFVYNREVLNRDFLVQILAPSVCVFTLCEF